MSSSVRSMPVQPPSPTLSSATRASMDFPMRPSVLITRADLRNSLAAYEALLSSAKAYTSAMLAMATASSDLACALETCARVKGAQYSGPALQAASGLHFLKSNYEQVLCDTFWKDFSIPLLSHYDTYRSACNERQVLHDAAIQDRSRQLKQAEARNNRAGRKRERDLSSFRRALAELQSHVDGIDQLKAQYYTEVLDAEQQVWSYIESKVSLIVRSQVDISERISSKGINDPVLEQMLATVPDPFNTYGPAKQDGEIFSILPPISLLSSSANSMHNSSAELGTNDTSVTDPDLGASNVKSESGTTTATAAGMRSRFVLPHDIMSPSTPSKGLSRAVLPLDGIVSASATPTRNPHSQSSTTELPNTSTPRAHSAACKNDNARHRVPQDSPLDPSETPCSDAVDGGLFGSESMDFEQLLEREQRPNWDQASTNTDAAVREEIQIVDAEPDPAATITTKLRHILSSIDENFAGPWTSSDRTIDPDSPALNSSSSCNSD